MRKVRWLCCLLLALWVQSACAQASQVSFETQAPAAVAEVLRAYPVTLVCGAADLNEGYGLLVVRQDSVYSLAGVSFGESAASYQSLGSLGLSLDADCRLSTERRSGSLRFLLACGDNTWAFWRQGLSWHVCGLRLGAAPAMRLDRYGVWIAENQLATDRQSAPPTRLCTNLLLLNDLSAFPHQASDLEAQDEADWQSWESSGLAALGDAHLRMQPTTASQSQGVLGRGLLARVLERQAAWYRVQIGGLEGWVNEAYLHPASEREDFLTSLKRDSDRLFASSSCMLYQTPGGRADPLPVGQPLRLMLSREDGWRYVAVEDQRQPTLTMSVESRFGWILDRQAE